MPPLSEPTSPGRWEPFLHSLVGFHGVLSQALSDRQQTQATSEVVVVDNIAMATGLGGLDSRLWRDWGHGGQMALTAQERKQWLKPQQ